MSPSSCRLWHHHDNPERLHVLRAVLEAEQYDARPHVDPCRLYLHLHHCLYFGLPDRALGHDWGGVSNSGQFPFNASLSKGAGPLVRLLIG